MPNNKTSRKIRGLKRSNHAMKKLLKKKRPKAPLFKEKVLLKIGALMVIYRSPINKTLKEEIAEASKKYFGDTVDWPIPDIKVRPKSSDEIIQDNPELKQYIMMAGRNVIGILDNGSE